MQISEEEARAIMEGFADLYSEGLLCYEQLMIGKRIIKTFYNNKNNWSWIPFEDIQK